MGDELERVSYNSALRTQHSLPLLERHVHDVGERGVAVVHADIEPFFEEGPHRIEPLLFPWPTTTDPDSHAVQLAFRLGLAKAGNDSAERLLHIREVGYGSTD